MIRNKEFSQLAYPSLSSVLYVVGLELDSLSRTDVDRRSATRETRPAVVRRAALEQGLSGIGVVGLQVAVRAVVGAGDCDSEEVTGLDGDGGIEVDGGVVEDVGELRRGV